MSPMLTLNSLPRHHRRPQSSQASSLRWPTKMATSIISLTRILTTCLKSMLKTIQDQVQNSSILNRALRRSVQTLEQTAQGKINLKGQNLKLTMKISNLEQLRQALTVSTKSNNRRLKSLRTLTAAVEACLLRR